MKADSEEKWPAILVVEPDSGMRAQLVEDLQRRYEGRYQIVEAPGLDRGEQAMRQLAHADIPLAVIALCENLVSNDHRKLIHLCEELFPDAKQVLLLDSIDSDQDTQPVHRYDGRVVRQLGVPTERLALMLDDLLSDWSIQAGGKPLTGQIKVIGHRWSRSAHEVKDFLARNRLPVDWFDVETNSEAAKLYRQITQEHHAELPIVIFADGTQIDAATVEKVAEKIGLDDQPDQPYYDVIIVGGGPAGLSTGVYAGSEGLKTAIVERSVPGGQAGLSARIDNYLGFPGGISGAELAQRAIAQAERFQVEVIAPQRVTAVRVEGQNRIVVLQDGQEINGKAVVLASGVTWRELDVANIENYIGVGVYYGSTAAEYQACRDEMVYVLGGANSAGQAALHLAASARQVTLLVRNESIEESMSEYLVEQIRCEDNITVRTNIELAGVQGDQRLQAILMRDQASGETEKLQTGWLFVYIGAQPETGWLRGVVELDEEGYILVAGQFVDRSAASHEPLPFATSQPGIFAVGDVIHGSVKRVANSVGQGAVVVSSIHRYIEAL